MSPSTKIARIAVSLLTLLLLSGLVAFASSPASSYGLAYEGSFFYSLDGNGNRTLESIAFDEGRILKSGSLFVADYHIKDHLGSVRAVVRNGNIIEEDDYYPYGAKMAKPGLISQTSPVPNRYLFSSKEDQAVAFGSYGLDFGARDYAHDGLTWFEPDPLASKYHHLSPYTYCAGNPLKFVDKEGRDIILAGLNGSSITVKTDLTDITVNVGNLGVDWGSNQILEGSHVISAALDIAGYLDPTGISDFINAKIQFSSGLYFDGILSAISAFPGGDLLKISRVGKDINALSIIANATSKTTLHRPYVRKNVREIVEAKAKKTLDGKFIDPNTKKVIEGKYDLGHTKGNEYRKLKKQYEEKGVTQKEFNDKLNNPDLYQIEDPHSNRSHKYEEK